MSSEAYYRIAVSSALISTLTILILLLAIPGLYRKANQEKRKVESLADEFQERTKYLWSRMLNADNSFNAIFFSRPVRSPWDRNTCRGCYQLACPSGPTGPPGEPGPDGEPGRPGEQGPPGDDGFDVQLEPEPDLPCVICPAGPPGLRGHQGERGRQGPQGTKGQRGIPGRPGEDGPRGNPGKPGIMGPRGLAGPPGPPGDTVIAGVGPKGPKGPPGPMGPKGPTGPAGKPSNIPGIPGKIGDTGPMGPAGRPGRVGDDGPWGPPGEPGEPAAYCPSDCGVSEILAPAYMRTDKAELFSGFEDRPENEDVYRAPSPAYESSKSYGPAASAPDYVSEPDSIAQGNLNNVRRHL